MRTRSVGFFLLSAIICIIVFSLSSSILITASTFGILVNILNFGNLMRIAYDDNDEETKKYDNIVPINGNISGFRQDRLSHLVTREFVKKSGLEDNKLNATENVDVKKPYKGDINYSGEASSKYELEDNNYFDNTEVGNDKVAAYSLRKRRGTEREKDSAYNKQKMLRPMLDEEFHNAETLPWWGNNDN